MKLLDVVALLEDIPEENLKRGTVGTIVEVFDDDYYEVEFSGNDGVAYAMLALHKKQLMVLYWESQIEA